MRRITISLGLEDKREMLEALGEACGFPAHYGRNLDALHDCLGDMEGLTEIRVEAEADSRPLDLILRVLDDTAEESRRLTYACADAALPREVGLPRNAAELAFRIGMNGTISRVAFAPGTDECPAELKPLCARFVGLGASPWRYQGYSLVENEEDWELTLRVIRIAGEEIRGRVKFSGHGGAVTGYAVSILGDFEEALQELRDCEYISRS